MVKILHLIQVSRSFTSNASSSPSRWSNPSVLSPSRITLFITRIRWFHVPLTFAATFVALAQLRKYRIKNIQSKPENEVEDLEVYKPSHLEVSMYKMLPLRTLSRLWGWINSINLPTALRTPVLKSYASTFGCNLDEAYIDDLRQYRNLGEFFRRSLKPGVRPIHGSDSDVVSPSDGTILHLGSAKEGFLEQVKGITYTIESFLGPNTWSSGQENDAETGNSSSDYQKSLLHHNPSGSSASAPTGLYYCTVYLAPGDYHKFHSPTNWTVNFRRHFPGKLYSVRPAFVSWFPNVFSVNERVAYVGNWKYGFFSMAPVGATNVGSMRIYFDDELKTNQTQMSLKSGIYEDKHLGSVQLRKGEPFGEFNLGSTIVLIFEAPKGMKFNIRQGMKIKYGELISLLETECAKSAN